MKTTILRHAAVSIVLGLIFVTITAMAQEESAASTADDAAQANNPLARITSVNLQQYYMPELTGFDDVDANQFWLRVAKPFSIAKAHWIARASLPFNSFPAPPTTTRNRV